MNRTLLIVLGVLLLVLVAGGSFYGGTVYGKSQAQTALPNFQGGPGGRSGISGQSGTIPGGQPGSDSGRGGMLAGEIVSVNGGDMTLKDTSGQEIVVHVTDTTLIQKQAEVTVDALAAGDTVFVSGTRGDDGSYTARSVQVSSGNFGVGMPGGFPGGGQPGSGAATPNP